MARVSKKCPPGSEPLNPPGFLPEEVLPPGTPVPDPDLPPGEEEPEPEPEFPPHEGDDLEDGTSDRSWDTDEIIEDVVLGGEGLLETVEEEDSLVEDVVLATPPVPDLVNESGLDISKEEDFLVEDVVFAPIPHIPEILERGFIDTSLESDLISEQVIPAEVPPPPDLPPPPEGEFWNRTLANQTWQGDLVVPAGERWLIGAGVRLQGNLRTEAGTIGMRPGSSLEFIGVNPDIYVGGGNGYAPEFANDFGIWIGLEGVLDIKATPKVRWNRTGLVDPAINGWQLTDQYFVTPTDVGDFSPRAWLPGQAVPQVHASVPAAEVLNVTSDVVIKGGHIHIISNKKQTLEYFRMQEMGVSNAASGGPVLGRYGLHLHHSHGSPGTVIRGVVSVDAKGKVFVPHGSHGVTIEDCVAVNSWAEGLWWDPGHATNDFLMDRCVVAGVRLPSEIGGGVSPFPAYHLGGGLNMVMKNCVACGVWGSLQAPGFDWPEPTTPFQPVVDKLVWDFNEGNVAHNNRGPGVRFWTNNQDHHDVSNFVTYRNAIAGIENGAYFSATQYHNVVSYEDGYQFGGGVNESAGFLNNASATVNGLGVMQLTDSVITSLDGPALKVGHRQLPATHEFRIEDCVFTAKGNPGAIGVPLPSWPKVWVHLGDNPWLARFVRCNVAPTDIVFETSAGNVGSQIFIEDAGGPIWLVEYELGMSGNRKVTAL